MTRDELAELILQTGHHHHQAFLETDGGDPEWALWYAGYLQAHLWDRAGTLPTRSLLVHLLLAAEEQHAQSNDPGPWPAFYAGVLLARLSA
jgi:NAD(P)H-hydrate epimerase